MTEAGVAWESRNVLGDVIEELMLHLHLQRNKQKI